MKKKLLALLIISGFYIGNGINAAAKAGAEDGVAGAGGGGAKAPVASGGAGSGGEDPFNFSLQYVTPSTGNKTAHATSLLVTCVDFRLVDESLRLMTALGAIDHYDEIVLPGASLAVANTPILVNGRTYRWGDTSMEVIKACLTLHPDIGRIIFLDHENCGAYNKCAFPGELSDLEPHGEPACTAASLHALPEKEQIKHKEQMAEAFQQVKLALGDSLKLHAYIMHIDGIVENWTTEVEALRATKYPSSGGAGHASSAS